MLNIGILGCADIAYKRFIPAVKKIDNIGIIAIASQNNANKLEIFRNDFGLEIEESYERLIAREDIDIIYIPQPPARHYEWAKYALEHKKHVLLEKPLTINCAECDELVKIADKKGLALYENYMFACHNQMEVIKQIINSGQLGKVRLFEAHFGFPFRGVDDFRYDKRLGGGALLDAGGYTIKLASLMLDKDLKVNYAYLENDAKYDIDIFGNCNMSDGRGIQFNASFGMECQYSCDLEIWGSKGRLTTNRIFTAPPDYSPQIVINTGSEKEIIDVDKDDHFMKSVQKFIDLINNENKRISMYAELKKQAKLMEDVRKKAAK